MGVLGAVLLSGLLLAALLVCWNESTCLNKTWLELAFATNHTESWWTDFRCDLKFSDALVGYLTFCLVIVGLFQAKWMGDTVDATLIAANAADESAKALPKLERAFLFILDCETEDISFVLNPSTLLTATSRFMASLSVINYGRTPANIRGMISSLDASAEIPPVLQLPTETAPLSPDFERRDIEVIVGADRDLSLRDIGQAICPELPTSQLRQDITLGRRHLYFHGVIQYLDIFMCLHEVRFCRRYNPKEHNFEPVGGLERNRYT